jgi:hypothetical protein
MDTRHLSPIPTRSTSHSRRSLSVLTLPSRTQRTRRHSMCRTQGQRESRAARRGRKRAIHRKGQEHLRRRRRNDHDERGAGS